MSLPTNGAVPEYCIWKDLSDNKVLRSLESLKPFNLMREGIMTRGNCVHWTLKVHPNRKGKIRTFQKEVLEKSPVDEMSVEFVMGQFVRTEVSNCWACFFPRTSFTHLLSWLWIHGSPRHTHTHRDTYIPQGAWLWWVYCSYDNYDWFGGGLMIWTRTCKPFHRILYFISWQ